MLGQGVWLLGSQWALERGKLLWVKRRALCCPATFTKSRWGLDQLLQFGYFFGGHGPPTSMLWENIVFPRARGMSHPCFAVALKEVMDSRVWGPKGRERNL
ncbi:hypothetical protein MHYP_G00107280 [Metynnis hypsauchen]